MATARVTVSQRSMETRRAALVPIVGIIVLIASVVAEVGAVPVDIKDDVPKAATPSMYATWAKGGDTSIVGLPSPVGRTQVEEVAAEIDAERARRAVAAGAGSLDDADINWVQPASKEEDTLQQEPKEETKEEEEQAKPEAPAQPEEEEQAKPEAPAQPKEETEATPEAPIQPEEETEATPDERLPARPA
jgi:outer membrane biosynthesis protein TonB